jgi:peptidoglycan-associated lipoprotein
LLGYGQVVALGIEEALTGRGGLRVMRKRIAWILGSVLLGLLLVFGASCAKKKVAPEEAAVEETSAADAAAQAAAEEEAARRAAEDELARERQRRATEAAAMSEAARRKAFEQENIHFDFDKYVLTPQAMMILDDKAAWLRDHRDARVLIEGHADNRGTNEYNLALGDRRANSAKNYLVKSGVASSRMTTISYGEEQPLCNQNTESCWAKNRRAQFGIR